MPRLYDHDSQEWADVPAENVQEAVTSGRFAFASGGRIPVISPTGKRGTLPTADAPIAMRDGGYTYETEQSARVEQARKEGAEIPALGQAGLSALSTATGGLSTRYIAKGGRGISPEESQAFLTGAEEAHPIATTAGAVAGAFTPGLGTIAGAAGRGAAVGVGKFAAKEAAEGLGKRMLQKAATGGTQGAVEGAMYGAGHMVSEESLGRTDFSAEAIRAHVGGGALIGGGLGAVIGAAGPAITKAREGITSKSREFMNKILDEDTLREIADESALKVTGARGSDIRKLGTDKKIAQIGEDLRDYQLKDGNKLFKAGSRARDMIEPLRRAKAETTAALKKIRKRINDYAEANPEFIPDARAYLKKVDEEILTPLKSSTVSGVRRQARKVESELAGLRKIVEQGDGRVSFKDLGRVRKDLASIIYPKKPPGQGLPPQPPAHAAELQKAERMLEDFIEEGSERVASAIDPALAGAYPKARRLTESMIKASQMTDKAIKQDLGNRAVSLTDYLSGIGGVGAAVVTGSPVGLFLAGASTIGNKLLRERGRSTVARAAEHLMKVRAVEKINQQTESRISLAIESFLSKQKRGPVVPASVNILKTTTFWPKAEPGETRSESAKLRSDELARLMADPEALSTRIAAGVADIEHFAPRIAMDLAVHTGKVVQFLHGKAPKNPMSGSVVTPQIQDWTPSPGEISKFERYVAAATDPMSALDDLQDGILSDEGAEALRVLYPRLFAMTARKMAMALASRTEPLPFGDLVQVSILLDFPAHAAMEPGFISKAQQMYAPAPEQPSPVGPQGQAGGGNRLSGLSKLTLDKRNMTRTQQLEGAVL